MTAATAGAKRPAPCRQSNSTPFGRRRRITISVEIDYAVVLAFRKEAAKRDMTVARLVHDLLEAIADDNLTGAVLDA